MTRFTNKLKEISIVGITDIFSAGVSVLFWFYLATMIEPDEYGILSYFISIAMLASTISLFGANNTLVVYTAKNVKIQSSMYTIALIGATISSFVIFFIFFNIGASLLVIGYSMAILITSELLGRKFFKKYSKYVIIQKSLWVILSLGFYFVLGEDGILIGMGLSFMIYVIGIIKEFKKTPINFKLVKERSNFIKNSYLQNIVASLNSSLDKIIIVPLLGFTVLGNFSLGLQYLNLMLIIPTIVMKYLLPYDSSGIPNKKLRIITIIFAGILTVIGLTIGPWILSTVFPKFSSVDQIIRIISISLIPSVIIMMYHTKFLGTEKSRKALFASIIWTGTNIVGIVILGENFGVIGISFALVIASILAATYAVLADKFEKL
jgi:O-antigen/teichoic acid export membrane protein